MRSSMPQVTLWLLPAVNQSLVHSDAATIGRCNPDRISPLPLMNDTGLDDTGADKAGAMLQEEMDDLGPVRMKEVFDAQGAITNIIQEMEVKGEIIISGRRGEEIIT